MLSTRMILLSSTGASDSVRYPWAMATPKGPLLARSGSTWIHWWSSVASAKRLTRSCVMGCHSEYPSWSPTSLWKASTPSTVVVMLRSSLVRVRFPVGHATRVGVGRLHYADARDRPPRARPPPAARPPGRRRRGGAGGRVRGERRVGDEHLAGAGHGRRQPRRLDRAPGRRGRADRRFVLDGGRGVPLHDGATRADGARARRRAARAGAAPQGRG